MSRCSLLFTHATVLTMDPARLVIDDGFVAVDHDRIVGVGPMDRCGWESDTAIQVAGHAVLPGFVNAHTHSLDLLLRGGVSDDRGLYDWLANIVDPGCAAYTDRDIELATTLFSLEAIRSGVTTVVDSVEVPIDRWDATAQIMLGAYERSGLRTVYAQMFYDHITPELLQRLDSADQRSEPYRTDFGALMDLDDAISGIETVMAAHHGRANGRISVWPSPGVAVFCSREAFHRAAELAARYGVKTTVHVCESEVDEFQGGMRGIAYLDQIGYLGPDVLAGHCVQLDDVDLRRLAASGAAISNNPVSNMFLGNGVARVSEMLSMGVPVGIGTDDTNCNGTVNMLADLKFAALAQKARYRDAGAITAEEVLEMATIGGAKSIGMEDEIGSIEVGKKADLIGIDLGGHHLAPRQSTASALVYQAIGNEVRHTVIDGALVMQDRALSWIDAEQEAQLVSEVHAASARVVDAGHLPARDDHHWRSRSVRRG